MVTQIGPTDGDCMIPMSDEDKEQLASEITRMLRKRTHGPRDAYDVLAHSLRQVGSMQYSKIPMSVLIKKVPGSPEMAALLATLVDPEVSMEAAGLLTPLVEPRGAAR